jgi:hypothetical protein
MKNFQKEVVKEKKVVRIKSSVHNRQPALRGLFQQVVQVQVIICVREWVQASNKEQMLLEIRQKV